MLSTGKTDPVPGPIQWHSDPHAHCVRVQVSKHGWNSENWGCNREKQRVLQVSQVFNRIRFIPTCLWQCSKSQANFSNLGGWTLKVQPDSGGYEHFNNLKKTYIKTKRVEQPVEIILDPTIGLFRTLRADFSKHWLDKSSTVWLSVSMFIPSPTSIWILFHQLFAASNLAPSSAAWGVGGAMLAK